jgi:hypothetical protein|tara:strand:+ start:3723 stop:3905 length:183 start_codon:yes stop_codon:yes gene_type:complete
MSDGVTYRKRIPYIDHIVDGVEKQIYEYNLSMDDTVQLLTCVSEMIEDVKFNRYFENKIL